MADRASVHDEDGAFYVEWYVKGAWTPRELWFVGGTDQGDVVGQHKPFEAASIPEMVRITPEDEETDDWGYWKLALRVEGRAAMSRPFWRSLQCQRALHARLGPREWPTGWSPDRARGRSCRATCQMMHSTTGTTGGWERMHPWSTRTT